jgi:hypothetical protein
MEFLGLVTGESDVSCDRVLMGFGQPSGLACANSLGHVSEDPHDLLVGQAGTEEGCSLAFGEA